MSKVVNKGQFTALFNGKSVEQPIKKVMRSNPYYDFNKECRLPFKSRSYISVWSKVRANNDEREYLKRVSWQLKYNSCDFATIGQLELAKEVVKNYKQYSIKELMDMVTPQNEDIITKAIERKIIEYNREVKRQANLELERKRKLAEEKEARELKVRTKIRQRNIKLMNGLAGFGNIDRIYKSM